MGGKFVLLLYMDIVLEILYMLFYGKYVGLQLLWVDNSWCHTLVCVTLYKTLLSGSDIHRQQ